MLKLKVSYIKRRDKRGRFCKPRRAYKNVNIFTTPVRLICCNGMINA